MVELKTERWLTRIASIALGLVLCMALVYLVATPKLRDGIVIDSWVEIGLWGALLALALATAGTFIYVGIKGSPPAWLQQSIRDDKRPEESRAHDLIRVTILISPVFCGLVGILATWPILENTIDIDKLLLAGIIAGMVGVLLMIGLESFLRVRRSERWFVRAIFASGVAACSVAMIGYSNIRFSVHDVRFIEVPVLAREHYTGHDEWRLLVDIGGRKNWVMVDGLTWRDAMEGQKVQLPVQEGYWGWPIVRVIASQP